MSRLDFDGLDGSLTAPTRKQDTAGLVAQEKTQVGDQLASFASSESNALDSTASSDSLQITEPFTEPKHESADKTKTSSDSEIELSKKPLFIETADSKAGDKARSEKPFNQEDGGDSVFPALKISALFLGGILIGAASMLAWWSMDKDKQIPLVRSTDKPSEPSEPAETIVLLPPPENAEKDAPMIFDEQQPDAGSGSDLPAAPVAELEQTPPAVDAGRDDMVRQSQQINHLMATAYMQIMMKKLTLPEGDNALESYRKVLELQPQHQEARDGIENIRSIYISWADTAQRRGEWGNAELFLSRALRITPSDTQLKEELRRVREEKTAYLSREAEAARIGAVEAEPELKASQALPETLPELVGIENVEHEILTTGDPATALIQVTVSGKASRVELLTQINKQVTPYKMNESGPSGETRRPNDFLYTREIPLLNPSESTTYVVAAYKQDGTVIYSPQTYLIEPLLQGSALVINEFMVANTQTIADPQGDYDDWIELYNRTSKTLDISGYYLSDDKNNPKKWQFPTRTTIGGYGYLLVWADGEAQYTGVGHSGLELHTNFQLSKSGEYVLLVDSDANENKILDETLYERQPTDFSIRRYPNGVGEFSVTSMPTPGIKN